MKLDLGDTEQRSKDLPYNCPSPTIETSMSVSSELPTSKIGANNAKEEPMDKERSFELELFETSALDAEDDIETAGGVTHRGDMLELFETNALDTEDDIETTRRVRAG